MVKDLPVASHDIPLAIVEIEICEHRSGQGFHEHLGLHSSCHIQMAGQLMADQGLDSCFNPVARH